MSAPVLTIAEQRASISGKKKKKKTVKNVLGIPDNLKIECPSVQKKEIAKLQEILNRLLPSARLAHQEDRKSSKDSTELTPEDVEMRKNAKNNRDQLSLGVNALNKSIKKNLISAALLADDVQPKFLVTHLNLLCVYNKIPFLLMPELRETTRMHLGFPCIALGFKTDSSHFAEAVQEIKSVFQAKKQLASQNENEQTEMESSDSDEVETPNNKICPQNDETPFSYLYRSSIKERAFIPEKDCNGLAKTRPEGDFILVEDDAKGVNLQKQASPLGISARVIKKQQLKKLDALFADADEDLDVPRKKAKKDWVIDKRGTKNCKYYPAKLFKVPSNPNRNWKKK